MAINSAKPARETAASIIIQTDNDWSERHIEAENADVQAQIIAEFCALTDIDASIITHATTHKWRYANTNAHELEDHSYWDESLKIGVCGDWCMGGHVESAYLSATDLLQKIT